MRAFEFKSEPLQFSANLPDGLADMTASAPADPVMGPLLMARGLSAESSNEAGKLILLHDVGYAIGHDYRDSNHSHLPPGTTLETCAWGQFNVEVARTYEESNGKTNVFFKALIPLSPHAIQITVSGTAAAERQWRRDLQNIVATVRGTPNILAFDEAASPSLIGLILCIIGLTVTLLGRLQMSRHLGLRGLGARFGGLFIVLFSIATWTWFQPLFRCFYPYVPERTHFLILMGLIGYGLLWIVVALLTKRFSNAYARTTAPTIVSTPTKPRATGAVKECGMCQHPVPLKLQFTAKSCDKCGADLTRWRV